MLDGRNLVEGNPVQFEVIWDPQRGAELLMSSELVVFMPSAVVVVAAEPGKIQASRVTGAVPQHGKAFWQNLAFVKKT